MRYDKLIYAEWNEHGPEFDVEIDNLLLDLEPNETWNVTWSNESAHCYGLTLTSGPHWFEMPDDEPWESFELIDVSESSGWRAVLGASRWALALPRR